MELRPGHRVWRQPVRLHHQEHEQRVARHGVADAVRCWQATLPVNIAAGAEFRYENYTIVAGEQGSWVNGGVRVVDVNGVQTTRLSAPGAQVFPGFKGDSGGKSNDAGAHSRNNSALYADVSSELTSKLLVDVAGRFENY